VPMKRKRKRGRPRLESRVERLVAYMPHAALVKAKKAAAAARRSFSSWVAEILEREARRQLRAGEIPLSFFETKGPPDPKAGVRRALARERERGL
jgi:hypothetical protein